MNKLPIILMFVALALPINTFAQPDREQDAPRDRATQRDRRERPGDRDRPVDRERPGDRQATDRPERTGKHEPITVEQIDDAIATLRAMHPDDKIGWLERVEAMAKEQPEEAAKRLSRFPRLRELMKMRENNPAEFELHATQSRVMREVFPLVRQIRQAQEEGDEEKVEKLKGQLRERIEELFTVRLKLKEFEIKRIRKHLERAEQELAKIKADSDKLIDEKMNELMAKGNRPRGPREDGERPERPKKPNKQDHDDRD